MAEAIEAGEKQTRYFQLSRCVVCGGELSVQQFLVGMYEGICPKCADELQRPKEGF